MSTTQIHCCPTTTLATPGCDASMLRPVLGFALVLTAGGGAASGFFYWSLFIGAAQQAVRAPILLPQHLAATPRDCVSLPSEVRRVLA
jgi:hypothetical protein